MEAWVDFEPALTHASTPADLEKVATCSETMLSLFDQLTDLYERSMQMLLE